MDVTLSKRGDYVMRAAICLARAFAEGSSRKIREVVDATDVPRSFASQILADLVRAGIATSKAGRDGGYRLARPPAQVTVLEVVEAAEGPLRFDRCALGDGPCRWQDVCPLHETWSEVAMALRQLLASTSLEEVAERDAAIESGTYAVPASSHRANPTAIEMTDTVQVELGAPSLHVALARECDRLGTVASTAKTSHTSLTPVGANGDVHYLLAWREPSGEVPSWVEGRLSVKAVDD
ncbi:MAG TPA: Rrf2 family transcriptional regulator, partial [Acidimicrobiales bacterium]|nr:Rrf2 family transcriptional regulator [Acidimicrobiales bacterium]